MINFQQISYRELIKGHYKKYNDKYGIADFISENIKNIFISSPNIEDVDKTAVLYAIDNDEYVGRSLIYETSIKNQNSIIKAQSFGSIEVDYSQRGKGIGTSIGLFSLSNNESPVFICSLLSPACLSIMRKFKNNCTLFDFPEYIKIINTESAFACRGVNGVPLKILKTIGNLIIKILDIPNIFRLKKIKRKYYYKKETIVPEWAGQMCLNDNHKYAEYHDTKWLQWCLDNNLSGKQEDIQSFYSIYDNRDNPVGFFLTKERRRFDIKTCSMINGTICEWASIDKDLQEIDINLLSLETFSTNCYRVLTVTDNPRTEKLLRRIGFIKHGYMQMGIHDKHNKYPDIVDKSLWRIRFGCCNSILY